MSSVKQASSTNSVLANAMQQKLDKMPASECMDLIKEYVDEPNTKVRCLLEQLPRLTADEAVLIEECLSSVALSQLEVSQVRSMCEHIDAWSHDWHTSADPYKGYVYQVRLDWMALSDVIENIQRAGPASSAPNEKGIKAHQILQTLVGSKAISVDEDVLIELIQHTPASGMPQLVDQMGLVCSYGVFKAANRVDGAAREVLLESWCQKWWDYIEQLTSEVAHSEHRGQPVSTKLLDMYGSYQDYLSYNISTSDFVSPSASVERRTEQLMRTKEFEEGLEQLDGTLPVSVVRAFLNRYDHWQHRAPEGTDIFMHQKLHQTVCGSEVQGALQKTLLQSQDEALLDQYVQAFCVKKAVGLDGTQYRLKKRTDFWDAQADLEKGGLIVKSYWMSQPEGFAIGVNVAKEIPITVGLWLYGASVLADQKQKGSSSHVQRLRTVNPDLVAQYEEQWRFVVQNDLIGSPFGDDERLKRQMKSASFSALVQKSALINTIGQVQPKEGSGPKKARSI